MLSAVPLRDEEDPVPPNQQAQARRMHTKPGWPRAPRTFPRPTRSLRCWAQTGEAERAATPALPPSSDRRRQPPRFARMPVLALERESTAAADTWLRVPGPPGRPGRPDVNVSGEPVHPSKGLRASYGAMFTFREPFYARFGYARSGSERSGGVVDGRKLWTSGAVTAVIVFGLTIAAFLLVHGMLNYPLLGVRGDDAVVYASMFGYAGGAALVALLATAAMRFLLLATPRPRWFFGWLGGVGTAIAVLLPLALSQDPAVRVATAAVNLVLGLAIIGLVRSTAASLRPDGSAELP